MAGLCRSPLPDGLIHLALGYEGGHPGGRNCGLGKLLGVAPRKPVGDLLDRDHEAAHPGQHQVRFVRRQRQHHATTTRWAAGGGRATVVLYDDLSVDTLLNVDLRRIDTRRTQVTVQYALPGHRDRARAVHSWLQPGARPGQMCA